MKKFVIFCIVGGIMVLFTGSNDKFYIKKILSSTHRVPRKISVIASQYKRNISPTNGSVNSAIRVDRIHGCRRMRKNKKDTKKMKKCSDDKSEENTPSICPICKKPRRKQPPPS